MKFDKLVPLFHLNEVKILQSQDRLEMPLGSSSEASRRHRLGAFLMRQWLAVRRLLGTILLRLVR